MSIHKCPECGGRVKDNPARGIYCAENPRCRMFGVAISENRAARRATENHQADQSRRAFKRAFKGIA